MKRLLEVCLVAVTLAAGITPSIAAQPAAMACRSWRLHEETAPTLGLKPNRRTEQSANTAPALQKGIHVEMAVTRYAVPVPDADQEDSLVVAVAHDGRIYLRVDPITQSDLTAKLKASMSNNSEKKLYVKADARTSYSNVANVLDAANVAGIESLTLLTSQRGPTQPGALVPPKGLEVHVGSRSHYGPGAAVVKMLDSGQQWPKVTINGKRVPWASVQTSLADLLRNQSKKVVLVNAEDTLPFSDVVNVIDVCRSVGAEIVLVWPKA